VAAVIAIFAGLFVDFVGVRKLLFAALIFLVVNSNIFDDANRFSAALLMSGFVGLVSASCYDVVPRVSSAKNLLGACNGLIVQISNEANLLYHILPQHWYYRRLVRELRLH